MQFWRQGQYLTQESENQKELATYGETDLHTIAIFSDSTWEKWMWLRMCRARVGYSKGLHFQPSQSTPLRITILTEHAADYANILKLVEITLVLPMPTACCERGFSAMKRAKNDWRSSLSNSALNSLLRMVLNRPPADQFTADSIGRIKESNQGALTFNCHGICIFV